ncbi:MAG: glycosyltransferase family 4 protein [Patescibacteria group bacterium]
MSKKSITNHDLSVGIFIGGDFIPSYAGATNQMHYLSRYLQKAGVKVVIFHGYRGWTDLRLIAQEPFKTYIFPIDRYYGDLDFLANLIRKENLHIIQFNDLEPIISQGIKLSQATGAYIVSESYYVVSNLAKSIGASVSRIRSIQKLEAITGSIVDHVICLSKDDKPKLRSAMKISDDRISVVPSGVDLKEIKYWGPNFDSKTVLFLGNLYFEPNADAVRSIHTDILPALRQKGFRFLVVGDCPPMLKRKYESRDFKFTGPVRDLNVVFRQATVALAPIQESTGLCIKILNYLGAGLPVISTSQAASGISNIKHMVIENDLRKYAGIVGNLTKNRRSTVRRSIAARRFIENNFDWQKVASRTASVYRKVLNQQAKDKSRFISLLSEFNIGKPAWLEEAEKKGRFANSKSLIKDRFSYGIIQRGRIRIIK